MTQWDFVCFVIVFVCECVCDAGNGVRYITMETVALLCGEDVDAGAGSRQKQRCSNSKVLTGQQLDRYQFCFFINKARLKKIDVGLARLSHFHLDKLKARDRSPTRSMFTPRLSHIQNSSAVNERQHEPNETAAEAAGTTPLLSSPLLPRKRGE